MNIQQGYTYHIKDEFFNLVQDNSLMSNRENGNYRPNFYAIADNQEPDIFWLIPISSQVTKFSDILAKKIEKFNKCYTIVIGLFGGDERAFLIQNAFPITKDYLDHVHTVQGNPVTVHTDLDKLLKRNLRTTLALHKKGIKLIFSDIDRIYELMKSSLK